MCLSPPKKLGVTLRHLILSCIEYPAGGKVEWGSKERKGDLRKWKLRVTFVLLEQSRAR